MTKIFRYFLFSTLALSVLFLASCEEDPETPLGDLAVSTSPSSDQTVAPGDTVEVDVTITNASATAEATVLSDAGGNFVDSDNTATTGESVSFIVPADAEDGDIITLTVTVTDGGQQANAQLALNVETTVVDIALSNSDFSTLVAAVVEAGLVDDLQGAGPFTVFAPTNDAFADLLASLNLTADELLASDDLENILLYHVVPAEALSTSLETGYYETLSGDSLYILVDGGVFVNGVEVTTPDLEAGNGVVHVIDEVLFPNATTYEAFLLAAPDGDANNEAFFSTETGELYSFNDVVGTSDPVSETIDFGYFYGGSFMASLLSPDNGNWTSSVGYGMDQWGTRNTTVFRTTNLSAEGFDAIASSQGDAIEAEFEAGSAVANPGRVSGLVAGDVVAFQTEDNRYGLVKVMEVVGTTGVDDGIRIAVKVTN